MSKTIYIITSGSYSSYSIDCVFTNKKLAESYFAAFCDPTDAQIEEWGANEIDKPDWKPGMLPWVAVVDEHMDGTFEQRLHTYRFSPGFHWKSREVRGSRDPADIVLVIPVMARNETHARKIVMEKWSQTKAMAPEWGKNVGGDEPNEWLYTMR